MTEAKRRALRAQTTPFVLHENGELTIKDEFTPADVHSIDDEGNYRNALGELVCSGSYIWNSTTGTTSRVPYPRAINSWLNEIPGEWVEEESEMSLEDCSAICRRQASEYYKMLTQRVVDASIDEDIKRIDAAEKSQKIKDYAITLVEMVNANVISRNDAKKSLDAYKKQLDSVVSERDNQNSLSSGFNKDYIK